MAIKAQTLEGGGKKKVPAISTLVSAVTNGATAVLKSLASAATTKKVITKDSINKKSGAQTKQTKTTKKSSTSATAATATPDIDIVSWSGYGGITFFVRPNRVKGVKDISIKASTDTEDKENGGEKYTNKKNTGSMEISMTAILNSMLGVGVEDAARQIIEAARRGESGYFYVGGKKLFTPKFMMVEAEAKDILLTGDGTWASCNVTMTLKQCEKYGGGTDNNNNNNNNNGGGGYKYSVRVYYSGSSGAVSSVVGYSNVSKEDARKKAWAKVPSNAHWASETQSQASNQTKRATDGTNNAKDKSKEVLKDSKRNTGGGSGTGGGVGGVNVKVNVVN